MSVSHQALGRCWCGACHSIAEAVVLNGRLGHVDRLGYVYCASCHPEETQRSLWPICSDQAAHVEDECEFCHRPLADASAA